MSRLQDRSDALWTGAVRADHTTIVSGFGPLEEVLPGLAFVESFANVTALDTGDGLVIFDTGSPMANGTVGAHLRRLAEAGRVTATPDLLYRARTG